MDLDDFERRLRAQTQRHNEDDPLAELARIVGEQPDPYDDVFAQPQAALRPSLEPHRRQEPSLDAPKPRLSVDFAAIEAGLRGGGAAPEPASYAGADHDPHAHYAYESQQNGAQDGSWADPARAPVKRGSRRPVYAMAASIAIAVVGIGVAFAYKGTGSSPREIKTIMAAAGPTKIQPPADATSEQTAQDADAQQTAPTKLVSREEQPVDLSQAVQDNAARNGSRGADAESVPVPLSPAQAAGSAYPDYSALGGGATPAGGASADSADSRTASASPAYGEQGFGVGMPQPKRVKSVSVRPDGTILSNESAPDATPFGPSVAPLKSNDQVGSLTATATPVASTPKSSARATPRATARVAPPSDDASADAPAPAKPAKKAKSVRIASAETGTPAETSDAAEETKPAGMGSFAVQLAAPGSEADARSTTSRLLKKFGGALHGRRLGFRRADSNGRTVYRVRVSSLTKEDAASLCSKLKSDGGTCFIAKE